MRKRTTYHALYAKFWRNAWQLDFSHGSNNTRRVMNYAKRFANTCRIYHLSGADLHLLNQQP